MASIYRFTRKRKKEDPKNGNSPKPIQANDDFFPLLFSDYDTAETEMKKRKEPPLTEEAETVFADAPQDIEPEDIPTLDPEATREVSLKDTKSEKARVSPVPDEATRSFSSAEAEEIRRAAEKKTEEKEEMKEDPSPEIPCLFDEAPTREIPPELLKALENPESDQEKMDAIFGHAIGSLSSSSSRKESNETTELLRKIFGSSGNEEKATAEESSQENISDETPAQGQTAPEEGENENYVAIHDTQKESTKEYRTTFSIQEELNKLQPDDAAPSTPEVAQEVTVSHQNPYSDTYDELDHTVEHSPILPEEFTSEEEYDEFAEHLRNNNFKGVLTCFWSFIAMLAVLYLESATFSGIYHPEFLKPGGIYNMIYLLVDIQLILVSALLVLPTLGDGFKALFRGKPNRNTIGLFMVLLSVIHPGVMLALGQTQYPLFGTLAALFVFFMAIANFMDSKRIYRTFRICGKRCDKLVVSQVEGDSPEKEAFLDQLEGEPLFYSVGKARFIDGFFSRIKENAKAEKSFGITLILSLLISLAFGGYSYWKEANFALATTRFMTMAAMSCPLSGILTVCLPFSHLSRKAEQRDCAIVSAAAAEQYAAGDVVSFTDKEIFPPKNVKVSTIRTYGQTRIDNAILYAAMIFQKLGGPLSHVFKKTISGVYEQIPENFDFLEITADGMCAKINGKEIFVGNKNYMLSYDFGYTKDVMDEDFEANSGKIMYMVIGAELAAKFYIHYSISKRFKKTILSLFKCGICPAVKTCDPNIDSDLFRTLLRNDKIPAGIIKTCDAMKDAPVAERSESGLVCTSSIANLLHCFTLCDSLKHLTSANTVMKILSVLVGAGIVLFLYFIENLTKISGLFALVYQLLWTIPVIIPSLTE